jgi:hypothetical protein
MSLDHRQRNQLYRIGNHLLRSHPRLAPMLAMSGGLIMAGNRCITRGRAVS